MAGRVEGKVAFVTGAARGQGRSHAVRLASEGADIIAIDVLENTGINYEPATAADLAETVRLVEAQGRRIHAAKADVRDYDSVKGALDEGVDKLGRVDIVLGNAGIITYGTAQEQSDEQWDNMIATNLTGVWHTAKAAIPHLIAQGDGGSIITTSSAAGLRGVPGIISYASAKWGVVGLTKSLAHELAEHRVRCNVIHPTNVQTDMLDNPEVRKVFRPDLENPTFEDAKDAYASLNLWPLPWVQPIDISNAVLFLASDEARYITGISLPVDLGFAA
jgi:SDR family mycofactocin-dependent oxidoreductase